MSRDLSLTIHKLRKRIYKDYLQLKEKQKLKRYLKSPNGKKIYILGSPTYTNLGDSAILIAQINFIKKFGITEERIKEVTFDEYYANKKLIRKCINRKHLICGLGGGNMGNQWPVEEDFRYDMLNEFPKNPVIIFPQTIYYIDNGHKKDDERKSISHYDERDNIVLVAREKKSYQLMQELYQNTKILLVPDIVLSSTKRDFGVISSKREGVLFCIRNDAEKSIDDTVWEELKAEIKQRGLQCQITDMYSEQPITKENRAENVYKKMQEFASSQLVITDRLHGMVFAAITGTPCIVFSNYNHKVKGTYDWIDYLPYIKYVTSFEEAQKQISKLLQVENCVYNSKPLEPYYNKISEVIANGID